MKQTVFAVINGSLFISRGDLMFPTNPRQRIKRRCPHEFTISKEKLMDKIKGGWAGQTIGLYVWRSDGVQI